MRVPLDFRVFRSDQLRELIRFYQAAIVNTGFGYGLYSLFLILGMMAYAAQLLAHLCGMAFNYVTYSRHVFRGRERSLWRFIGGYAANYLIGLVFLAGFMRMMLAPSVAGLLALLCTSVVNFIVLRFFVFARRRLPQ